MTRQPYIDGPAKAVNEPALLSADAAAAWLGLSRSSVFRLVRDGRLRACRPLKELRFRVVDLAQFVSSLEPIGQLNEAFADVENPAKAVTEERDASATSTH